MNGSYMLQIELMSDNPISVIDCFLECTNSGAEVAEPPTECDEP